MIEDARSTPERLATLSRDKEQLLELLLEKRAARRRGIEPRIRERDADGRMRAPSSWAQQRLWFIEQLEGGSAAYNVPLAVRLHGPLDPDALRTALDALVQRHDVFRTVFTSLAGDPMQEVRPEGRFALMTVHLSGYSTAECEVHVRRHRLEEANELFDLHTGPLIRGRLLHLRADDHVLLLTLHHIISDGWSVGVLLHEVAELYSACRGNRSHTLDPLPIQYADYAEWQRGYLQGSVLEKQLTYWRSQLEGAPPCLDLPTDRPRPNVTRYKGSTKPVVLGATLSSALSALARQHGMTLFMVLYAAWAILLSRLSGQEDVVIGTPVANRRRPELEGLIGFFVNTLALRIDVNRDASLAEFFGRIKAVTLGAYDHQDMPFEQLVEALRPERSLNRHPIFQVMLVLQNAPQWELRFAELDASVEDDVIETSKFDLLLAFEERGNEIIGVVNYDTDLLDEHTVERWIESYTILLRSMTSGTQCRLADLPILSQRERLKLLEQFNSKGVQYPQKKLIHELFEQQVERTPCATAVVHGKQQLTYAELNARANQLARFLSEKEIGSSKVIGICVERSLEMIVGLLGILKAGAAYLPLDPSYPADRLEYMLQDTAPSIVLTQSGLTGLFRGRAEFIELDAKLQELTGLDDANLTSAELAVRAPELVYVIYTSGSTGRPKGTAMPHRAMANLIEWHRQSLPLSTGARVLQFAALSFDVAFQEMFSTLCGGGTLVLLDEWARKDARSLVGLLTKESVERLFLPPVVLQGLAEYFSAYGIAARSLKDVIAAGEQLKISPEVVDLFEYLGDCRLHNHYGPTETHVVTALTLDGCAKNWPSMPTIGRPISNTQIYILDSDRQPVPIGVTGEIYIAGANVARGYLNRPELTAERFLVDPFSDDPHARMYKAGDLGHWRADGTIEYLGRNDDQVKVRGFRIELGEIEAELAAHEQVKEAAVVATKDPSGMQRLVAYVTQRDQDPLNVETLRMHLKDRLPDYMVPSAFVTLERMPLTPSGKLNRRALPAPDLATYARQHYEPPQGEVESKLAEVWQELLRVEGIGRDDSFFDLGGHSLLVLKALFAIERALGCTLKVVDVYKAPTIRQLADRICGTALKDDFVELEREAGLDDEIAALGGSPRTPARAVMLTGATGFVGRFLLAQLLEKNDATIYCLVRARSKDHANLRLRTTLAKWDLWHGELEPRIVAIPGDLRLPRLGLSDAEYALLCEEADAIYHCGTSMNHLETYTTAKPANVEAVRELLRIATSTKPKVLNYISTLGVFGLPSDGTRVVDERTSIDDETHLRSSGYVASKWVGEKMVMSANERGIPCNIFRLGLVWADARLGRYDELQRVYRIIKSCLLSGFGIKNYLAYESILIPVDFAAEAIIHLATQHRDGGGIFHISSSDSKTFDLFETCNGAGTALKLLPFYDWIREMQRLHLAGRSLPAVPLIEYAFTMDETSFYEHQRRIREGLRFSCARTRAELEQGGIVAPMFDEAMLRVCLESMLKTDAELRESIGSRITVTTDCYVQWNAARVNSLHGIHS